MSLGRNESLINRRAGKDVRESNDALTLVEKIFILSLKEGHVPFWSESLSSALRGCILIELCLRGRIGLEPKTSDRTSILTRRIVIRDGLRTGERLLDEVLKYIKDSAEAASVPLWLEYLGGYSWNPLIWRYHMKQVKERIAKDLVEKGILEINKVNFMIFESCSYPARNEKFIKAIALEMKEALLKNWRADVERMGISDLTLVMMANAAGLYDKLLLTLPSHEYALAQSRLEHMSNTDFEKESRKLTGKDVVFAVFSVLLN